MLENGANVTALYQRAQGYTSTADFVAAEVDIKRALLEEPGNKDVRALHKQYKVKVCSCPAGLLSCDKCARFNASC